MAICHISAIWKHDLIVPARNDVATGSYANVAGSLGPLSGSLKYANDGVFFYNRRFKVSEITDGLSHTLFTGETIEGDLAIGSNIWSNGNRGNSTMRMTHAPMNTPPGDTQLLRRTGRLSGINIANGAFQSRHPGGANFAYGDGHITFHPRLDRPDRLPRRFPLEPVAKMSPTKPTDKLGL